MKIIIPAKAHSLRLPQKNWREFYSGKNLVEIKIEQLLRATLPVNIYLSSDGNEYLHYAESYGINFILRKQEFASDETPWPDAFYGMIDEIPVSDDEDIAWIEVINPLFDQYSELFSTWEKVRNLHDSLVMVAEFNKFLIGENGKPINFNYGKWHSMSQHLETQYIWDSACIMSKRNMKYFSYPIGKTPFLYKLNSGAIDIDTMEEFKLARYLYSLKFQNANQR